jgi:hypothetical protein
MLPLQQKLYEKTQESEIRGPEPLGYLIHQKCHGGQGLIAGIHFISESIEETLRSTNTV